MNFVFATFLPDILLNVMSFSCNFLCKHSIFASIHSIRFWAGDFWGVVFGSRTKSSLLSLKMHFSALDLGFWIGGVNLNVGYVSAVHCCTASLCAWMCMASSFMCGNYGWHLTSEKCLEILTGIYLVCLKYQVTEQLGSGSRSVHGIHNNFKEEKEIHYTR